MAKIYQMTDINGQPVYPKSVTKGIYDENGKRLDAVLIELENKSGVEIAQELSTAEGSEKRVISQKTTTTAIKSMGVYSDKSNSFADGYPYDYDGNVTNPSTATTFCCHLEDVDNGDYVFIKKCETFAAWVIKAFHADGSFTQKTVSDLVKYNDELYYCKIDFLRDASKLWFAGSERDVNKSKTLVVVDRLYFNFINENKELINSIASDINSDILAVKDELSLVQRMIDVEKSTIISTSALTTKGYYWGDGAEGAEFKSNANYLSYPELIPVSEGQKIIFRDWTKGDSSLLKGILAMSVYDNDRKPYNGNSSRINFSQLDSYDFVTGNGEYTLPKNSGFVGISISKNYGLGGNIIIQGSATFTDEAKEQIKSIAGSSTASAASVTDYYLKGKANKAYNDKKLCIIAAGQSNIDGRVPVAELPDYIKLPIANCLYNNKAGGTFAELSEDLLISAYDTKCWAFDLVVYNQLCSVDGQNIYVIKHSMGGTSIDTDGATDYHWTADYEYLTDSAKSLLLTFEKYIRESITSQGENFEIRAVLWHQGEGDTVTEVVANRYYENLKKVIAYIRGVVGNPVLPFITGSFSKERNTPEYDTIREAQKRIEQEDPYFYLVDMYDSTLRDAYHFDAKSSEYFGKCCYNYLIDAGVISSEKIDTGSLTE